MQRVISRRLYQAVKSATSAKKRPATLNTQWKKPLSDTIVNFRDKIDTLNQKLVKKERELFLKHDALVAERQPIIDAVETAIFKKNKSRLVKVGSLSNRLAVDTSSDIDLCLLPHVSQFWMDFRNHGDFRSVFMHIVKEQLERIDRIDPSLGTSDIFMLCNTRVPLLTVRFNNGITMDIQFPDRQFHSLRNTNLVRHYAAADVRFRQLYLWLRTLFTKLGIKNSKEGLFSSYHIILLVVHFLQAKTTPPVLPVVSKKYESAVSPDIPLEKLLEVLDKPFDKLVDWKSENKRSAAELAVDLIDYYSKFDPIKNAIAINKGITFVRKQFPDSTRLLLLDPFSPISVARSHLIPGALSSATAYVKRGQSLGEFIDSFPEFPEAANYRYTVENKVFRGVSQ